MRDRGALGRAELFEFHDREGFPAVWRNLLTDYLSFYAARFKPYRHATPVLAETLKRAGAVRIVDLCSGAGQPVISLVEGVRQRGFPELEVVLTDKYPNVESWRHAIHNSGCAVSFEEGPVDAVDVPERLTGLRTLFTSFHHFSREDAVRVLSDAVEKRQGVGVFEYTERNWIIWGIPVLLIPLFVWMCTPFMRPFRWRRLLWTYLVPVVPFVALWDGFVSCLRTYSVDELGAFVEEIDASSHEWDIGRVPSVGLSRVTYLVGLPRLAVGTGGDQKTGVTENVESECG